MPETKNTGRFLLSDTGTRAVLESLDLKQYERVIVLGYFFRDLLDEDGCEMYLKPAGRYVGDAPVPFGKVVEASVVRGEIAIGYRIAAQGHDSENGFGIKVNPKKQDLVALKAEDQVLVLAMS